MRDWVFSESSNVELIKSVTAVIKANLSLNLSPMQDMTCTFANITPSDSVLNILRYSSATEYC